jgi:hypothetical protein
MPHQSAPPSKRLPTTPSHRLPPTHIRSSLDVLLAGHPLLGGLPVQVGSIHRNPTTRPLVRVNPMIVGRDMTLDFWDALILLDMVASDDRILGAGSLVDQRGAIVTLQGAGGVAKIVRCKRLWA